MGQFSHITCAKCGNNNRCISNARVWALLRVNSENHIRAAIIGWIKEQTSRWHSLVSSSPSSSLATRMSMRCRASVACTQKRAARALQHLGIFGGFASREIPAAVINVSTLAYAPVPGARQRVREHGGCRLFSQTLLCRSASLAVEPLRFRKARESQRVPSSVPDRRRCCGKLRGFYMEILYACYF